MPTDTPPPRRKWNIARWLLVFALLAMVWGGWRAYAFRSALAQAKALGWTVGYTDPVETIRKNWKSAFKKETWLDGVTNVDIATSKEFVQHLHIAQRLNPYVLRIHDASELRDLTALKSLSRLHQVYFSGCAGLTNVDGIENLFTLRSVILLGCKGLTNAGGLKNLTNLEEVWLTECAGPIDVGAIRGLPSLKAVVFDGSTGLKDVNALKGLSALKGAHFIGCTGLTNLDALKTLSCLKIVSLQGCTGLVPETVAALKAALPNTKIIGP